MSYKQIKYNKKTCVCGTVFSKPSSVIRPFDPYCSPACAMKHKTGNVKPENMLNLPLQTLREIATGTFQDYVKERDKDKGCYTCPETKGLFHAGHAWPKKQFTGMILNEKACKKVCDFCNCVTDTDGKIMQTKIQAEIGIVKFIELENEAITTKNKRWSKIEFIEAIAYFKAKIEELKSAKHNVNKNSIHDVLPS